MPEIIIGHILLIAFLICALFFVLNRIQQVCPRCGETMKVIWVGREVDARKEKVYFGGKRMIAGTVTQYAPFLRCKNCGHEIPLGSNNTEGAQRMKTTATAYFAGGCFWCITPTFKETPGVFDVISGYSGGDEENPVYADVKYQRTGHRETIRVDYDPEQVSFETLFEIFLNGVDPFDAGGQFIDRGHSYTLAVYYRNEDERRIAENGIAKLQAESGQTVYIALEPFKSFYAAEEEHQDYYLKHPAEFEQELIDSGRKER